ncbi:uncharacterized protein I303_104800 [Kwoniella dejecticola CBS 10117]|uniref:Uncharacterized protein n=1 Tax=Kwoniella dejecticola CBS 10117 TaxID=1296121 RepID=A0A1A6A4B0_9TREE|nr:uncharacterized protein I303_04219 [Kwoniella dejecticola CBS 10117]OBR84897.1 hypothetical protein I303_04219 [Kwoniella dejecticola CBS 10117]
MSSSSPRPKFSLGEVPVPKPKPHPPQAGQQQHDTSPNIEARSRPSPRLSPIIARDTITSPVGPIQPQFAELLTPLKFRRKRNRPPVDQQPTSIPPVAGPSRLGYYTLEGDLYRGAVRDPTIPDQVLLDEDALSVGGSSTSSASSTWSENLERVRDVIGRFGEALGVRRGSHSSNSSSSDSSDTESHGRSSVSIKTRKRRKRRGSKLSRVETALSRQTSGSPHPPKRQHIPKRREFTLLLPPRLQDADIGVVSSVASSEKEQSTLVEGGGSPSSFGQSHKSYPPERVVVTPSLPVIIEHINSLRLANGYLPTESTPLPTPIPTPNVPLRKSGSAPGRSRTAKGPATFTVPRPLASRTQSRLHVLRGDMGNADPIRPKSVSDLLGLARPDSTGSLTSLKAEYQPPTGLGTPTVAKEGFDFTKKGKAEETWWLDVSCPGWEDLRDLGELLGLHPLTLEDVLQQDPREKLDHFDKLGYYFLVVRALDESYFKYTPGSASSSGLTLAKPPTLRSADTAPEIYEMQEPDNRDNEKKEGRRRGWGMGRATGKNAAKQGEKVEIVEDNPGKEGLEGVGVGAVNVYLVVFSDGIVSFHFEDISKHTRRVIERALNFPNPDHNSDWIAHGIIDSIVDAFFPLIRYVDGEVDDIDSLTIDPTTDPKKTTAVLESEPIPVQESDSARNDLDLNEKSAHSRAREKPSLLPQMWNQPDDPRHASRYNVRKTLKQKLRIPSLHISTPLALVYFRLFFLPTSSAVRRKHEHVDEAVFDRSTMLKRITDMRRLVTGLTRLLGAKGAVIGRLRKRAREDGTTMEAYIGDVEDHILLLQTSLYHYEYILSHCQPAYLSHLNVSFSFAKGGTDKAILALSTVTISILPMQLILGLFSMNANVPHNGDADMDGHAHTDGTPSPLGYFAGIVVGIFLVACVMLTIIRYWRWLARKKWSNLRGAEVPEFWEGFWGWR